MHLADLIKDLAVILGVAGIVTLLFQRIRQPVVLGYIVAGMIVGPHSFPMASISDLPNIQTWAELGVIFLMFSLGLEFSFRKLTHVGISAGVTAVFEVSCMLWLGFWAGKLLGWNTFDSLFAGAMVSISSTTILLKALDELNLKTRRFAEMIFGVLIVEDLIAILILVALSTVAVSKSFSSLAILTAAGQLVLVIGSWFMAGYFLVPRFVRYVGRYGNNEMLTVVSIALCLALVVFAAKLHYSTALGAFIMGSILSESSESHRIEERLEPLRDLFAAVFFVSVGMLIDPAMLLRHWQAVILLTLVTVFGKIIAVTLGAMLSGQTMRTAVQVGFGLAQIGEFSFIIAGLGLTLKVTGSQLYPIAVAVSGLTAFSTPYLIRYSHKFAVWLEKKLPLRARDTLSRYSAWALTRRADAGQRKRFYSLLLRWVANGILVTVVFTLSEEFLLPNAPRWAAWIVAALLASPFLWGMLGAFRTYSVDGGTLFVTRFLTVFWAGLLSAEFFPLKWALLITGVSLTAFLLVFYRWLENTYVWFERNFLSTFEDQSKTASPTDVLRDLAPWDAHLVRIKVHPNADLVLKTIGESRLRADFGLNVVAIQRGLRTIVAPTPEEPILPKDELLVLGTDEQVEKIRPRIEKPPGLQDRYRQLTQYELTRIELPQESQYADCSIRASGIREKYGAMVVGLERDGTRSINPSSDLKLKAGDTLWVVGDKDRVAQLGEALTSQA